jgi:hypothetical protein
MVATKQEVAPAAEPSVEPATKPFNETLLTVLREYSRSVNESSRVFLQVRCLCGVVKEIYKDNLPRTLSCGCLNRQNKTKHGQHQSPTYKSWQMMLDRCRNPKNPAYKYYGSRGIQVCERWLTFDNFFADMGHRPEGKTINRIKNDGNYEPDNCNWATRSEQMENTRQNRLLTIDGEALSVNQWAIRLKVKRNTLYNRLFNGWTPEETILTPVGRRA